MESGRVVLNGVTQETPFRIVEPLASYSPLAIEGDLGFIAVADIIARATRTVTGRRLR
jgi:hypothetical protein